MSRIRIPAHEVGKLLSEAQKATLQWPTEGELDIISSKEGTWTLSSAPKATAPLLPIHHKVLKLLSSHKMPDVMEGRFEKLLSNDELAAFQELLSNGRVQKYKSNPNYPTSIYRIIPSANGESIPSTPSSLTNPALMVSSRVIVAEKPLEEYSLAKDGFMIVRNENAAKSASFELAERIRSGEVRGLKSFDGFYYIIETALLDKIMAPALDALAKKKTRPLEELDHILLLPPLVIKIALEFAK